MGRLVIAKVEGEDMVGVSKDFRNMTQSEISHFICEIEIVKQELLDKWRRMSLK